MTMANEEALAFIMEQIEVTFSRVKPAGWPPLHAARIGADRTLCGIEITVDWAYDSDCDANDVECNRCRKMLKATLQPAR